MKQIATDLKYEGLKYGTVAELMALLVRMHQGRYAGYREVD